jgi:hypothetical protein
LNKSHFIDCLQAVYLSYSTIDAFKAFGMLKERILPYPAQRDPQRPGIYFSNVSWNPTVADIGIHIVCFSVIDNTG